MIQRFLKRLRAWLEPLRIEYGSFTHIGDRKMNSDYSLVNERKNLFLVADGAGERSGRIASRFTSRVLSRHFEPRKKGTLLQAALEAHEKLRTTTLRFSKTNGKGITMLSALHIDNGKAHIVHGGDSSIFLLRNGRELQRVTPEEYSLLHGIGTPFSEEITPFTMRLKVKRSDVFLLCTDGLTGFERTATGFYMDRRVLRDAEIKQTLQQVAENKMSSKQAAVDLVNQALARYARDGINSDNVTALVLRIK